MSKLIDITNQTFSDWTVIERDLNKKVSSGNIYWICKCKCGTIRSVEGSKLRTGKTTSCGKCKKPQNKKHREYIDLTGQTFGKWKVVEKVKTQRKNTTYRCICECGKEKFVEGRHLKDGTSSSCGCNRKGKVRDLTGQRFGKLIVLKRYGSSKENNAIWECQCDCGNICIKNSKHLINLSSTSCGCQNSSGENIIEKILIQNNIIYKKEYKFPDLLGNSNNLRFDFAIFNKLNKLECLIEYQGQQHYKICFGLDEEALQKQKNYDQRKIDYCKNKGIKLIIIPYTDKNKLSWEYLDNLIKN